jgi:hypothetical protein
VYQVLRRRFGKFSEWNTPGVIPSGKGRQFEAVLVDLAQCLSARTHLAVKQQVMWGLTRSQKDLDQKGFVHSYTLNKEAALDAHLITKDDLPDHLCIVSPDPYEVVGVENVEKQIRSWAKSFRCRKPVPDFVRVDYSGVHIGEEICRKSVRESVETRVVVFPESWYKGEETCETTKRANA